MNCKRCGQITSRRNELCEHCGTPLSAYADESKKQEDDAIDVNFVVVDNKDDNDEDAYDDDELENDFDDDEYDDDDDEYEYADADEDEPNYNNRQNRNAYQNRYMPPPKKRWIAILLCALLWFLGAHRFYLGLHRSALLMFALAIPLAWVTGGITEIIAISWWIYDLVMLILKRLEDAYGRPVGVYKQ